MISLSKINDRFWLRESDPIVGTNRLIDARQNTIIIGEVIARVQNYSLPNLASYSERGYQTFSVVGKVFLISICAGWAAGIVR